jgi:hypothetical protein
MTSQMGIYLPESSRDTRCGADKYCRRVRRWHSLDVLHRVMPRRAAPQVWTHHWNKLGEFTREKHQALQGRGESKSSGHHVVIVSDLNVSVKTLKLFYKHWKTSTIQTSRLDLIIKKMYVVFLWRPSISSNKIVILATSSTLFPDW